MGHAPGVGHRLRATTFVLGPRDAILRPNLHGYADDIVSLLAEKVARHAGIDPAAHPQQDALFAGAHFVVKVMALRRRVNAGRTGTLMKGLPVRVNRHGKSFDRMMPMRESATTSISGSSRGKRQWRRPAQILI